MTGWDTIFTLNTLFKYTNSYIGKIRKIYQINIAKIYQKYIKLIADTICSPLTYIINSYINSNSYPTKWKLSRVVPVPKVKNPNTINEYRPISIQVALSKVFERLVLLQLLSFIENNHLYKDTMTGFRKGFNTNNALIKFRDDILKSMKSGEVTLAVLIDFSKAFDTISHEVFTTKLYSLGFSNQFITWVFNYLSYRQQFVQIDDKKSRTSKSFFGVPQGSILGPIFFNLYVSDLQDKLSNIPSIQYADDTTIYLSSKPNQLDESAKNITNLLSKLQTWSEQNNLAVNADKTKLIVFASSRLNKIHSITDKEYNIMLDGKVLEKVAKARLLGVTFDQHLQWNNHVNATISSVYGKLSILKKLKNFVNFKVRKLLAQSLLLSQIDFGDPVYSPISLKNMNKLQRLQRAVARW